MESTVNKVSNMKLKKKQFQKVKNFPRLYTRSMNPHADETNLTNGRNEFQHFKWARYCFHFIEKELH